MVKSKTDYFPKFQIGDKVKQIVDTDGKVYLNGVIVSVFQSADPPSLFAYTMRTPDGRVMPFDPDIGRHCCIAVGQIVFRIGALVDDIRSIFPEDGMPGDNLDLHAILKHIDHVNKAIIHYNVLVDELKWYIALRQDVLDF